MRHFKRFKNWVVLVYYACWTLSKHVYSYAHKREPGSNQIPPDRVTLDEASMEFELHNAAQPSNQQPARSSIHQQTSPTEILVPLEIKQTIDHQPSIPSEKAVIEAKVDYASAIEPQEPAGKYQPGTINDQTAQRLARLLVSEIKLYYKSKTGGENSSDENIYDLLKEPIEQSRKHYKERIGPNAVKTMPDYFHGELIRSLCGGDASRLGPNYPTNGDSA